MSRPPRSIAACALALVLCAAGTARAQEGDSATVRLIQLLIAKGILNKDQAASLLQQAQSEARAPRRPAAHGAVAAAVPEPPAPLVPQGTVRVTYVPPIVRDQIAAQVREQVLGEEQANGWAAPNALPEWTKRITVYGDIRLRGERVLEDPHNKVNAETSAGPPPVYGPVPYTDFNSINNGSPYDVLSGAVPPTLNTTEDRTRFRVRARLGVKADIADWVSADVRLATGNDTSPVTENQTLGQNGPFDKFSIWLDRADVLLKVPDDAKYDPRASLQLYAGRFANPFWTTNLEYADDVNFDGAAVQAVAPISASVNGWATAGAFAVYNTAFNYGDATSATEFPSRDKYLFAGQVGADWKPSPSVTGKFAAGFFAYSNVEGKLSSPCVLVVSSQTCDTDNSRTQFLQFGNTVFPIRDIAPGSTLEPGTSAIADPQYYGLASRFHILDLHARMDFARYDPLDVEIEGEFSKNFGYNRSAIVAKGPANNVGNGSLSSTSFEGGDTAWLVKLEVGKPDITRLNQWNAYFGYKHLDTDSVLDALTDSDFHEGGTNAKGFFVGVDYGIGRNTYLSARWLSANTVSGPTYGNDVVQIDLNSKF